MNLLKLLAQTIVLLILLAVAWVAWVYQDHLTPVAEELVVLYTDWNRNAHWSKQAADRTPPPAAPVPAQAPPPVPADAAAPLLKAEQETTPAVAPESSTAAAPAAADAAPAAAPAQQAVAPVPEAAPAATVSANTQPPPTDIPPPAVASPAAPAAPVPAAEPAVAAPAAAAEPPAAAPVVAASAPLPQLGAAAPQAAPPAPGGDPSSILGRAATPHLSATVLVAKAVDLPVDPQELHARARRAAWSGQTDAAIAAYQQLIALQPQSADAHGELGNVYYQEKRQEAAVEQYEKAALLLVSQGDQTRIWQLLQTLRSLDANRARAVEEKLLARGK